MRQLTPRHVVKWLLQSWPQAMHSGNSMVLPGGGHFLRCFLFEKSRTKGVFHLWKVVAPLFAPQESIVLNFGERLVGPDGIQDLFDLNAEGVEIHIGAAVLENYQELADLDGVEKFLLRYPFNYSGIPWMLYVYAMANYLGGNSISAIQMLEELMAIPLPIQYKGPLKVMARQALEDIGTRDEQVLLMLRNCENDVMTRLFPNS